MSLKDAPTVLIVDDEDRILASLQRTLRREGYRLLLAQSPREALRLLNDEPVDLVMSDHKMPGMSGPELLSRAADLRPRAVRMLITGWPQALDAAEIEALGIAAVITKPWEDAELKGALREALR